MTPKHSHVTFYFHFIKTKAVQGGNMNGKKVFLFFIIFFYPFSGFSQQVIIRKNTPAKPTPTPSNTRSNPKFGGWDKRETPPPRGSETSQVSMRQSQVSPVPSNQEAFVGSRAVPKGTKAAVALKRVDFLLGPYKPEDALAQASKDASLSTGRLKVSPAHLTATMVQESTGNCMIGNKMGTSAQGCFQFLGGTWEGMVSKYGRLAESKGYAFYNAKNKPYFDRRNFYQAAFFASCYLSEIAGDVKRKYTTLTWTQAQDLALLGWKAGPGALMSAMSKAPRATTIRDFIYPPETDPKWSEFKNYVNGPSFQRGTDNDSILHVQRVLRITNEVAPMFYPR